DVDDPDVVVFIDEHYEGVGGVDKRDLYPGHYRVFVRKGSAPGRVHEVDVAGGSTQTVAITWRLERVLRSGPEFVGFAFDSDAERREHEHEDAVAVARGVGAKRVVLVTVGHNDGRRALVASLFSLEGANPERAAIVPLEPSPPGDDVMRALARYLAGGD